MLLIQNKIREKIIYNIPVQFCSFEEKERKKTISRFLHHAGEEEHKE
jgi:hypothetical protein